ncbi:hypothetical protein SEA_TUNATARTARE_97 [Streptomyces phage TunaTartare]|uniref:Uncharacterized protein n=1 Tax=Streptomyces phage TunaTartare TaxID=2848887 RepID=A0A8F2IW67_9CAUD|nr:hypothetical protein PP457_gp158 [Streptomyces phage TunaTartare]QWT29984.1 hypothetical protein SEA_TUNATARTARE_97 [Streptomyces phage TunaTartare]
MRCKSPWGFDSPSLRMENPFKIEDSQGPSSYQLAMLLAIQSKPMYLGTVPRAEITRRRAANKRARVQRRVNRRLDSTRRS